MTNVTMHSAFQFRDREEEYFMNDKTTANTVA